MATDAAEPLVLCANRECNVARDGKCVEGFDLDKCPYYGRAAVDDVDEAAAGLSAEPPAGGIRLARGVPLDGAETSAQLRVGLSRVVSIIGAFDCGKTSVISGLFDLFQMGPVADVFFAGCVTLHGFEEICHEARAASKRAEAHSERTKRGEVRFYHLDVRRGSDLVSLLIADRSGEEYEEVADLAVNAAAMFELRRADVVTILIDGRKLCSPADRADTIAATPLIIQGMVESGAFERRPIVAIVLTKKDVLAASQKPERAMRDFEGIVEAIRRRFAGHFDILRSFVTCASPKHPKGIRGEGLDDLLTFWLAPSDPPCPAARRHRSGRAFDELKIEEPGRG